MKLASMALAALLAAFIFSHAPPAQAKCSCPSGSQSIAVGQETKADSCNLEILLSRIDWNVVSGDSYQIYVRSDQVVSAAGKPADYTIAHNKSVSLPAGTCGSLLIGAHRAPQKDYIELNWSYF